MMDFVKRLEIAALIMTCGEIFSPYSGHFRRFNRN